MALIDIAQEIAADRSAALEVYKVYAAEQERQLTELRAALSAYRKAIGATP